MEKDRQIQELGVEIAALRRQVADLEAALQKQEAADRLLDESKERYRLLADNTMDIIWRMNLDLSFAYVNPAIEPMFGYTPEEFLDTVLPDHCTKEDMQQISALIAREIENQDRRTGLLMETVLLHKDGRRIPVEVHARLVFDKEGHVIAIQGTTRDISERKAAEEDLRLSQFCIDHASIAIFRIDEEGAIKGANQQACKNLGYTREELCKMTVFDIDPTFSRERWLEHRKNMRARGAGTVQSVHRRKDGSTFPVEATVSYNEYEDRALSFSFVRDLTERKKAEEVRERLEEQFRQAQKMEAVGRLAGGVAHDFNNLLSVILGYGEMVMHNLKEGHPHHAPLREIHGAAERARNLTRQLLAFSRKQVLELKVLDVNQAITGFERLLRRMIGEDITLELALTGTEPRVKADISQLEQVLMNLAVNARDAMPDGGTLTIETAVVELDEAYPLEGSAIPAGDYVMIQASDTGCGMDKEAQARIFEPFFTTKGQDKGTGLGLATSYGIVRQHGGSIWVYSEPGQGTTFKIYLPLAAEQAQAAPQPPGRTEPVAASATVLVVEDDPAVRRLACSILGRRGYRVIESEDEEHAIELARRHEGPLHLLLSDVVMPVMKGPEVYQSVVATHPEVRVLYMSGYTDKEITRQGVLNAGVQFIQKPFTVNGLLEKVAETINP